MNQHGLYSKAAQIIRNLQQERGTADQMVAAAKVKSTELKNAGPLPEGKVTREQLAQHFENAVPKMYVSQYGENPSFMPKGSGKRFMDLQMRGFDDKLSPDEKRELDHMSQRNSASPFIMGQDEDDGEGELHDPLYDGYQTPGGQNYRERLLTLGKRKGQDSYHSSHWTEHENVLAHIRMKDRLVGQERSNVQPIMKKLAEGLGVGIRDLASGAASVGIQHKVITPEEAATLSRFMGWRNGYDQAPGIEKKLLHVEELQSDWGQEGRDKGFNTGEATKAYQDHIADMKDRFRQKLSWMGDDAAIDKRMNDTLVSEMAYAIGEGDKHRELGRAAADERGKVPQGPYVGNTQHWTDLALKNVLREAALGNYDGVVFTPGQAQADRYGLEKQVDAIHYTPETKTLHAQPKNGGNPIVQSDVEPQHLPGLIGKEAASKLLDPSNAYNVNGTTRHSLVGDDLKVGGGGMKGYYDNIVPKSVMALAKQHDPDAQPGEPVQMGQYQGFHLPMTDKMKSSILDSGFSAFKRGGRVGNLKSWFGNSVTHTNGEPHVFYTGTSKDKDFTAFNVGRHGAWFTRDPAVASQYAEQNDSQGYKRDGWNMVKTNTASRVIPAYVKAENPYTGEYAGEMHDNYKKAQSDWFDTLRAKGHDAWMPASQNGNLVVALKEPQQIKSLYNSGDFDPNQKHMGKAGGGEVDDPMFGHHNTSAKGVEVASGLGGIPMPSMAISKVAHPLENFGDVTLMAHPSMVTPSRDTNVWSADTYTGRQPRGDEEFSDPKAINRAMQADPNFGHMRDIAYWHDATNSVTNADEMMKTAQLGVARGIDPKQHASFHDYVSDVRQKLGYEAYKNDHMPGLRAYGDIKRVLYPKDLFTSSVNRKKPVDYTLENVMKRMKGAAEAGAEGFNYGPGNFRAIHTPKFASMGEIKSDRGLIVPSDQMKPIKSQFEDAYSGLVEKLVQATGRKGFRAYDEAADALTDISKWRKHDWFGDVPPELVSQIRELGRHASKMPTEYFEAKSKRAIPLASFPAALVPKSDPESARRLTEAGVKNVMQYGSPEERVAMYRSQPDLMFKNGGKAMALTRRFTKDGTGATMALKSKGN